LRGIFKTEEIRTSYTCESITLKKEFQTWDEIYYYKV